ncbi:MAG: GNAT family N-acetyltransferase [Lachnospiraceae bacterium]|nr:GNAT family N-acetyltransferase [Lachnospiraceae bacterium]
MEELKPSVRYYNSENCRFALYVYSDEPEMIYLSNVFVDKDSRGKGLGNDILRKAEVEARKMGGAYLRLKCLSTAWVHEWYEKHGFSDLSVDQDANYFWMEKKI